MTTMVQTDLGPPLPTKFKAAAEDPHRYSNSGRFSAQLLPSLHPQRSTELFHPQKQRPNSPRRPSTTLAGGSYSTPNPLGNGVLPHQTQYGQTSQEQQFYTSHATAYTTASTPNQYPTSAPPDLMATTAHMQRPYPPIYHTSQSTSASVASHTQDPHGRGMYSQSSQMHPQVFGYPSYPPMHTMPASPYATHPSPQQHSLSTPPLMISQQQPTPPQMSPPVQGTSINSSTGLKVDSVPQQHNPQRSILNQSTTMSSGNNVHQSSSSGTTSSSAPGPIPATTPLVVRQDNNGVQWIAFEYSRDRVKMEYTIRCDVESVNVDNLSQEFKTENCVYPRACCSKDQYRGNRLVYETECNAVGWALAELNPALRGKRGLIQRAVDSWRNSNQDPRLRSRRVRRMAKLNRRTTIQAQTYSRMAPSVSPVTPGIPGGTMSTPGQAGGLSTPRPGVGPLPVGLHHHHSQSEGSIGNEEFSGAVGFNTSHRTSATTDPPPSQPVQTDLRTAQVFHDYSTFPSVASASGGLGGPSMPPLLRESGIGSMGRHPAIVTSMSTGRGMSTTAGEDSENNSDESDPSCDVLFGGLPKDRPRRFILVDDTQRGCRVRVKNILSRADEEPFQAADSRQQIPQGRRRPGSRRQRSRHGRQDIGAGTIGG